MMAIVIFNEANGSQQPLIIVAEFCQHTDTFTTLLFKRCYHHEWLLPQVVVLVAEQAGFVPTDLGHLLNHCGVADNITGESAT